MTTLHVDIESYSPADLLESGVYVYSAHPDFEVLLIGYAVDDEPVRVIDLTRDYSAELETVLMMLEDPDVVKVAHNANFERTCLAAAFQLKLPPEQWRCTAVHAATLGLPRSLGEAARVLGLPEDRQKLKEGKALIQYFCKPCRPTQANKGRGRNLPEHAPEKWATFGAYCGQDVEVERAIDKLLAAYPVTQDERRLWCLDQRINDLGVMIDRALVGQAIRIDTDRREQLKAEALRITGLDNPNSINQLKAWLEDVDGINVESLDKATVPQLIRDTESAAVERVLRIRQELGKTSVGKYAAMERSAGADDRVRGTLLFFGGRTGRWCLAEGTPVRVKLKNGGVTEKPIQTVSVDELVWDGTAWVSHDGVEYSGDKTVIEWDGLVATPEHVVWVSPLDKMPLGEAKEKGARLWEGFSEGG